MPGSNGELGDAAPTPEEIQLALCHWRDAAFADWVVTTITLVARTRPDELRQALSGLFGLATLEREHARVMAALTATWGELRQAREDLARVREELQALESRMEDVAMQTEQANDPPELVAIAAREAEKTLRTALPALFAQLKTDLMLFAEELTRPKQ